ncbi:MAG TPA: hypothetical protein PLM93_05865 [Sulfuricurvum sp.]|nr:MAG: hypothetical protein B7Y30_07885 [Campylobacterales bacterium 16-40-21]OZA02762.1 MAG: hypothetical protein B7X89_08235 [Sulfuricurvum sp. 17-40-25]HQS66695.1 hypothetical protein [Sulfuricurvum sp.]HQT37364.1 hypothetical protein [Sulfuricurvum sp.]
MPKFLGLFFIVLSSHAIEPFQEQTPLQMAVPNISKDNQSKWIPLSSNPKSAAPQSNSTFNPRIDELIKTQVHKKMQTLLKPLNDEDNQQ